MEEVCALKKKIEDLEPVMKKAVIMAEPEPIQEVASSKRAARGKGGKAVVTSAVTDDHEKRLADLENLIKSQAERMKKTEDENKKLGALVAQLETKAGKQTGGSDFTQAQIQAINNSQKVQKGDSKRIDQLEEKVSNLTSAQIQTVDNCKAAQKKHAADMRKELNKISDRVDLVDEDGEHHMLSMAACIYNLQKGVGYSPVTFEQEDLQEKFEAVLRLMNISK